MKKAEFLTKQAYALPLYFFVPITVTGLLTSGNGTISQNASEITLTSFSTAIALFNTESLAQVYLL